MLCKKTAGLGDCESGDYYGVQQVTQSPAQEFLKKLWSVFQLKGGIIDEAILMLNLTNNFLCES